MVPIVLQFSLKSNRYVILQLYGLEVHIILEEFFLPSSQIPKVAVSG